MVKAINQRIEGTDIYVFSRGDEGDFTFYRPFELDEARQLADATDKAIGDYDVRGLRGGGLGVDGDGAEIFNVSTLRGILLNRVLMQQTGNQSWLPTIREGTQLHRGGIYRGRIVIDHGLALYTEGNPDSEVAQSLSKDAERLGIETRPVFASFRALDLQSGGKSYGVIPQVVSTEGLYSGEEAQKLADENRFVLGNSGVRRLIRGGGGWDADWGRGLGGFDWDCRVVGLSAVGSEKILRELVEKQVRQNYGAKREELEAQLNELSTQERETIDSAKAILNA